jgi:hypothetical protein
MPLPAIPAAISEILRRKWSLGRSQREVTGKAGRLGPSPASSDGCASLGRTVLRSYCALSNTERHQLNATLELLHPEYVAAPPQLVP